MSDDVIAEATRLPERDIYFLVFDRYGSDWAIEERFGIEQRPLPRPRRRPASGGPGRSRQLPRHRLQPGLDAEHGHARRPDRVGRPRLRATAPRPAELLADHEVGRFLRANGYRYYHLGAWYGPTRSNPIADEVRVWGKTTEFEQVLRDASIAAGAGAAGRAATEDDDFRNRHREEALFQLRHVARLADDAGAQVRLRPHPAAAPALRLRCRG